MTNEQEYVRGSRAALRLMLGHILRQLAIDDPDARRARWVLERERVIAQLRIVCDEHGDNDWDEQTNLADVIEKHLANYLGGE